MHNIDFTTSLNETFKRIRFQAEKGYFDGQTMSDYFIGCQWYLQRFDCSLVFSRDVGHHSSGWWKNPDYERCYHLSISFKSGRNKKNEMLIIKSLFGTAMNWMWTEPPYSKEGKQCDVWHFRIFCDENWKPIKPRGEVYSKEFTDLGWKSFSELHKL